MDVSIFKEFSKFNNVKFFEAPHVYFISDVQTISVTGLIGRFEHGFDEAYWSKKKALDRIQKLTLLKNDSETDEEHVQRITKVILSEWKYKNEHAKLEGKTLHTYLENIMSNKVVEEVASGPITFEEIKDTYYVMKRQANSFYRQYIKTGKLIPIKSELVVGNLDLGICGMIDQIFYNTETGMLQIWDWKTNTKLRKESFSSKTIEPTFMKHCLSHIEHCELNTYSIQLGIYKYIIEKSTNLKLDDKCHIVWFNENNENFSLIECKDYKKEIEDMFEFKKNNPELFKVRAWQRPSVPKPISINSMKNLLNF